MLRILLQYLLPLLLPFLALHCLGRADPRALAGLAARARPGRISRVPAWR